MKRDNFPEYYGTLAGVVVVVDTQISSERKRERETNASPCSIWKTEGGRRRLCSKVYRNRICLRAYRIHSKKVTQAIRAARASFDTPPMVAVPARSARVKVVVLTCLRASRIRFHRA